VIKVIEIDGCAECPHREYNPWDVRCRETDKTLKHVLHKGFGPPKWCPLPSKRTYHRQVKRGEVE
jgi:hypothetical protein